MAFDDENSESRPTIGNPKDLPALDDIFGAPGPRTHSQLSTGPGELSQISELAEGEEPDDDDDDDE